MPRRDITEIDFSTVYPLYVQKVERKNRTQDELDEVICWLTGFDRESLKHQVADHPDMRAFFARAPRIHPNSRLIKGVICGIRVEEIEDPLVQQIRYMDKLVDELAKGRAMAKILRS